MSNKKKITLIEMIPVFVETTQDMVDSLGEHLSNFEEIKTNSYMWLSQITFKGIVTALDKQKCTLSIILEQCLNWRKENLNVQQKLWVDLIEENIQQIEHLNKKILELANTHRRKTLGIVLQ